MLGMSLFMPLSGAMLLYGEIWHLYLMARLDAGRFLLAGRRRFAELFADDLLSGIT